MPSGLRPGEIYRVRQPQHGDPKKSRCFAVSGAMGTFLYSVYTPRLANIHKSSFLQSGNVVLEEEGALSFLVLFAVTDAVLPDQLQMVVSGDGDI
jgi:hypothetical protein